MLDDVHPIALAHLQGMCAARFNDTTPMECPWSLEDREATQAWFAGYSLATLVRELSRQRGDLATGEVR
jgi:hypothetical protein